MNLLLYGMIFIQKDSQICQYKFDKINLNN